MKLITKKSFVSLLAVVALAFAAFAIAPMLKQNSTNASAEDGVITGFDSSSVRFYNSQNSNYIGESGAAVTLENVTSGSAVDNASSPWVRYFDPSDLNKWSSHDTETLQFPSALTFETNVEGANDGKALAINNLEGYTWAGSFAVKLTTAIPGSEISALKIRYLAHTGDGRNRLRIWNYAGTDQAYEEESTAAAEDRWRTITIMGNDLAVLLDGNGDLSGFSVLFHWSQGGIYYGDLDHRCYIMLDEITYEPLTEQYTVTYDYNGLKENDQEVVKASPFKATRPADPVVFGYTFEGWYADAGYQTAYDFDAVLSADTTIYAKFAAVSLPEGVVAEMTVNDTEVAAIQFGSTSWTVEDGTIAQYRGPGFETYFPDEYFVRYITGKDNVTGLGEDNGNYVKLALAPGMTGASNCYFDFNFASAIAVDDIALLELRVYALLNAAENSDTQIILSAIGGEEPYNGFAVNTYGKEGEWMTIRVYGTDLAKVTSGSTLTGIRLAVKNARGSGFYSDLKNAYWNVDAAPCFVLIDNVTYEKPVVAYNVTFDYATATTGLANGSAIVNTDPFKVARPADPVVFGYTFEGWYADAGYQTAYDFDAVLSADTTIYAKFAAVSLPEGVVAEMTVNDTEVAAIQFGSTSWTVEDGTIAQYRGPGFETYFPDEYFVRYITGKDNVTGLGEDNGNYVKLALAPGMTGASNCYFDFNFASAIAVDDIALLELRVYALLNAAENSDTQIILSAIGGEEPYNGFAVNTYGKEGEWMTIRVYGTDLAKVTSGSTLTGIRLAVKNAKGSGFYSDLKNAYWDVDAAPCYVLIDSISYETELATYNVTYDYATATTGKENETVSAVSETLAVRPADPAVLGFIFAGWYADAEYQTAYDFTAAVTQNVTIYAKFLPVVHEESVIAAFNRNDVAVEKVYVGNQEFPGDVTIATWTGPGFETWFPDLTFAKFINGVDTLTGVGEEGKDYLKIGLFPDKAFATARFLIRIADAKDAARIGKITLRVYFHLNSIDATTVSFCNAEGEQLFVFDTYENEDQWLDLVIAGEDLEKVLTEDNFGYFILRIENAVGGSYGTMHNQWNNFEENPCYMYLDVMTYEEALIVTFDAANSTTSSVKVLNGATVSAPETPVKASDAQYDYTFEAWYYGDAAYDFTATVSTDITLTAHYTATLRKYTVSFEGADVASQSVSYGSTAVKPEDPEAPEGKTFKGWFAGDTEYTFEETVTEDVVLTAVFEDVQAPVEPADSGDDSSEESGCFGSIGGFGMFSCILALFGVAFIRRKR